MSATFKLPAFDNTLGAFFIGLNLSTILYGITCVQIFLYVTSKRSKNDGWWHRAMVHFLFMLDTAHQICNTMALYRFLITDYVNPAEIILDRTSSSGRFLLDIEAIFGIITIACVQLYFSWRVWAFSRSFPSKWRWVPSAFATALALLGLGSNIAIVRTAFLDFKKITTSFSAQDSLKRDWLIALPSEIACDVIITASMVYSLHRARTGIPRSDNVLKILIMFSVNTCLITTILTIAALVTFLVLPNSTIYAAIEFLVPKSYVNSALASLNSRDYLEGKLTEKPPRQKITTLQFSSAMPSDSNSSGEYELPQLNFPKRSSLSLVGDTLSNSNWDAEQGWDFGVSASKYQYPPMSRTS